VAWKPGNGINSPPTALEKRAYARLAGRRKRHYTFARRSSPRFGQIGKRRSRHKALIR
jgi:hypothetical protein